MDLDRLWNEICGDDRRAYYEVPPEYIEKLVNMVLSENRKQVGWLVKDYADGWFFIQYPEDPVKYEKQGHLVKAVYE